MSFLGDLFSIFTGLDEILNSVDAIAQHGEQLVQNVKSETHKIHAFKFDPKWKSRVINVPDAIKKTKDEVTSIAQQIHDALATLVSNLKALRAGGIGAKQGDTGIAKIFDIITKVKLFAQEVDNCITNLNQFVDALRKITEELSTLDSIFLQQGNSRKRLTSEEFALKAPYERIGKLHRA